MEVSAQTSFGHTAEYEYLEFALESRRQPYAELRRRFESFQIRRVEDFVEERQSYYARIAKLNPAKSDEEIAAFVDKKIALSAQPEWQYYVEFHQPLNTEYALITLASHAVCEAFVSTLMAVELFSAGTIDQFKRFDKASLLNKWSEELKQLEPTYNLPEDSELRTRLAFLIDERKALVHHKITLEYGGQEVSLGNPLARQTYAQKLDWMAAFLDLPYRLLDHARVSMPKRCIFISRSR